MVLSEIQHRAAGWRGGRFRQMVAACLYPRVLGAANAAPSAQRPGSGVGAGVLLHETVGRLCCPRHPRTLPKAGCLSGQRGLWRLSGLRWQLFFLNCLAGCVAQIHNPQNRSHRSCAIHTGLRLCVSPSIAAPGGVAALPQPPQLLQDPHPGFWANAGRTAPRRRRRAPGIQYHDAYSAAPTTMAPTAQSCHMVKPPLSRPASAGR